MTIDSLRPDTPCRAAFHEALDGVSLLANPAITVEACDCSPVVYSRVFAALRDTLVLHDALPLANASVINDFGCSNLRCSSCVSASGASVSRAPTLGRPSLAWLLGGAQESLRTVRRLWNINSGSSPLEFSHSRPLLHLTAYHASLGKQARACNQLGCRYIHLLLWL